MAAGENIVDGGDSSSAAAIFSIGLVAAFLAVGVVLAANHEMWRDEIEAWLLSRDSRSITDLIRNMRYVGHPVLWELLLMPLTRMSRSPVLMQPFNLLIASGMVWVFARFSPFSRTQKILFTFGYFPIYEYSIICRQYAIGALLICTFAALFPARYEKPLWMGSVLFLLSQVAVFTLIVVIAAVGALVLDWVILRGGGNSRSQKRGRFLTGLVIAISGILLGAAQIHPPADSGTVIGWFFHWDAPRARQVIGLLNRAFLPIPKPGHPGFYWEQWLDQSRFFAPLLLPVSCVLFVGCAAAVLRRLAALTYYLIGTCGLLAFFYTKLIGDVHHHGFLFFVFLSALWIAEDVRDRKTPATRNWSGRAAEAIAAGSLTALLAIQVVAGALAAFGDLRYPFSEAKATAAFIEKNGLADLPLLGEKDYAAQAVLGYLGIEKAYYARGNRFGSFVIWNRARLDYPGDGVLLEKARQFASRQGGRALIIMNRPLERRVLDRADAPKPLASFEDSAIPDENFWLYLTGHEPRTGSPPNASTKSEN
jgi:hypothetical protein